MVCTLRYAHLTSEKAWPCKTLCACARCQHQRRGNKQTYYMVMAEVHVIGELEGGSDFPSGDLFCKWSVSLGSSWRVLEGASEGQTQVDHPEVRIYSSSHAPFNFFNFFLPRTASMRSGPIQLVITYVQWNLQSKIRTSCCVSLTPFRPSPGH